MGMLFKILLLVLLVAGPWYAIRRWAPTLSVQGAIVAAALFVGVALIVAFSLPPGWYK
jgi:hypothetical protein